MQQNKERNMKIILWVHKNDVLANKILTYHFTRPVIDRHDEYLQVTVSQDEFAKLEDEKHDKWLVDQYNRNRLAEDQIENVNQIETGRSHDNYIYERNPDTNEVFERKSGDYKNRRKIN